MSINALAKALCGDTTRMSEIVRERRRITPDTAEIARDIRPLLTIPENLAIGKAVLTHNVKRNPLTLDVIPAGMKRRAVIPGSPPVSLAY